MLNRAIRLLLVLTVAVAVMAVPTIAQDDDFDSLALFEAGEGAFSWDVLDGYADLGLEGETVTIFGAFVDSDAAAFEQAIAPFEEVTGIDIQYEGSGDFETLIRVRVDGNDAPDIAALPQPGLFNDLGDSIVPVTPEIEEIMNNEFDAGWTTLATIGDELKGIVYRANTKSLVWYNPTAVEDAGYDELIPPETWDDMIALSDLMVA
ncbi:MAG: ABC transporter substrate-binding protein, partial [Chloroflexota bacterium]